MWLVLLLGVAVVFMVVTILYYTSKAMHTSEKTVRYVLYSDEGTTYVEREIKGEWELIHSCDEGQQLFLIESAGMLEFFSDRPSFGEERERSFIQTSKYHPHVFDVFQGQQARRIQKAHEGGWPVPRTRDRSKALVILQRVAPEIYEIYEP